MRKITMKSTKSTSENGGSVRGKSEDRATNFSDQENDNDTQDDTAKDADKSFVDSETEKQSEHLDDIENNSDDADETPAKKSKSKKAAKKGSKKNSDAAAVNGKTGGKKKLKKKRGTERKSKAAAEEDTEEEYEVEKIIDRKKIGSKTYFLIRWKGYSAKDDTWEAENTLNCEELIKDFADKVKKDSQQSRKRGSEVPRRTKRVDYTEDEEEEEYQDFLASPRKRQFSKPSATRAKKARKDTEEEEEEEPEEEYEVDKILQVQNTKRGGREFLVRWKGYPESQATWEPEDNLNCRDLLDRFLEKQKENHAPKNNKVSPSKKKKGANTGRRSGRAKGR